MRTYYVLVALIAHALMTGCGVTPGAPETHTPVFSVTAQGEGNELTVNTQGDTTVFDVYSRSGIGSGAVEFISGEPPKNIVIRLHLEGLEEFRLSYEEMMVIASVSSASDHEVFQSIITSTGSEQPIFSDSLFWMDVKEISDQAASPGTSESGYFEITLPEEVIQEGYRSFSIRWIDFFR